MKKKLIHCDFILSMKKKKIKIDLEKLHCLNRRKGVMCCIIYFLKKSTVAKAVQ